MWRWLGLSLALVRRCEKPRHFLLGTRPFSLLASSGFGPRLHVLGWDEWFCHWGDWSVAWFVRMDGWMGGWVSLIAGGEVVRRLLRCTLLPEEAHGEIFVFA